MAEGQREVEETANFQGQVINGWRVAGPFGDAVHFHGDWLRRAAAARAGIDGNEAIEAIYPAARGHGTAGAGRLEARIHAHVSGGAVAARRLVLVRYDV